MWTTALGFQGDLLGDSGLKGAPFAAAVLAHGIHVSASPGGMQDGRFLPSGIRWVVERLLAWSSRYRRLNVVFDGEPDLFTAHVWIADLDHLAPAHRTIPGTARHLIACSL